MPIKIQSDLPVKEILERENIFVMDEKRAIHQDIRPIQILILNLMPLKEDTELQLLRSLSNTPLQVDVTFMTVESHESKNTSVSHLNKFYQTFSELKDMKFDGMIITGAPVEQMEFEEVDYWKELDVTRYLNYEDFLEKNPGAVIYMASTKAPNVYTEVSYEDGCYLMFGKESAGIPEEILAKNQERAVRIPMLDKIRSLNLGNSVAIVLYEALRQQRFAGMQLEGHLTRYDWK